MARSVEEIKAAIKIDIRTYTSLDDYLFPEDGGSSVSVFNIIIFVVSAAIFTFEVIADNLRINIQAVADTAPSGNPGWLRSQILKFQYGDAITINTTDVDSDEYFVPQYAVLDLSKRIVTRCAVTDGVNNTVNVKVAKGIAPTLSPLTTPELAALRNYYFGTSGTQGVGFAGVNANFISLNPDRIKITANVYYLGQYIEATVKANVITSIEDFLNTFAEDNFGGTVFLIKLVDAVQLVEGVSRIEITDVKARPEATPLGSATDVNTQGVYQTIAGYIIPEDTVSSELDDTLTMIEETL
jgi:hypothetical protein